LAITLLNSVDYSAEVAVNGVEAVELGGA